MTQLRLYAIGIDEVRDMFGAAPEVASELRAISAEAFAPPQRRAGLLGRIGPLFKKEYFPPVDDPSLPSQEDTDNLLAGRYVAPDRMVPAWRVVEAWLGRRAWGQLQLPATPAELEALDFELARAGVGADLALGSCFRNDVQVPLRPLPGMRVGYAKHAHALAMADAFERAQPAVAGKTADLARQVEEWIQGFGQWSAVAPSVGRPAPDLVAVYLP